MRDDWCEEHAVPESKCVECNPDLMLEGLMPFKVNSRKVCGDSPWAKAYHQFSLHSERF